MPTDPTTLVDQLVDDAKFDALHNVASRLRGLLWQHERTATDDDTREQFRAERLTVRNRLRTIGPSSEAVREALSEWGARIRELSP